MLHETRRDQKRQHQGEVPVQVTSKFSSILCSLFREGILSFSTSERIPFSLFLCSELAHTHNNLSKKKSHKMKRVKKRRDQFGSRAEGKKSLAQSIILVGTIDFRTRKTSAEKSIVMILSTDELQCRGFARAEEIPAVTTVHTPCRLSNCDCFFLLSVFA